MGHLIQHNHDNRFTYRILPFSVLLCMLLIVLSAGCVKKTSSNKNVELAALDHPVDINVKALVPGVRVYYLDGFWRHTQNMPERPVFLKEGRQGKPIVKIDHRFGKKEVFDSGSSIGIGVQMEGFINIFKAGQWQFKAKSNDGIDIKIGQTQVVWDPAQHSDRFSEPISVNIPKPGFYLLQIRYFQRKGTATLEFYWKPPGEDAFSIIPEDAFWHL